MASLAASAYVRQRAAWRIDENDYQNRDNGRNQSGGGDESARLGVSKLVCGLRPTGKDGLTRRDRPHGREPHRDLPAARSQRDSRCRSSGRPELHLSQLNAEIVFEAARESEATRARDQPFDSTNKGANFMNAKRIFLALIITAVIATIAGAQYNSEGIGTKAKKTDIVGTWIVDVTPTGEGAPPPFKALTTFHSDGTLVETETDALIPPFITPGHGLWEKIRANEFAFKIVFLTFDEQGNP